MYVVGKIIGCSLFEGPVDLAQYLNYPPRNSQINGKLIFRITLKNR